MKTMNILAIHAHPDDIEILCAGTLALLKEAGHSVTLATVCNGDKGSPDKDQETIAAIRYKEAMNAALILDAEYHGLNYPDFEVFDEDSSRRRVTQLLRMVQPDIILTASPEDYMADHEITSALVRNAAFAAGIRNYLTGDIPPIGHIPALYYVDAIEGKDKFGNPVRPDFVVDISSAMPTKEKMLSCHASQREWLRQHHGIDHYVESMKEWSAHQGRLAGCQYAEGFRQHLGHAYPQVNFLAELLPGFVHEQTKTHPST